MSVQVSLWSNSTICLTDLPPFKMNSVTENRNVMEWGYILYILPRNGWHLNCIADLQMIHLKISYTYIYIWLVQLLLFSYLQGTMWSQSCRDNRCVILNSTFFSKWTVLKFGGFMSFGISTIMLELKTYFLARNSFGLYVNIR